MLRSGWEKLVRNTVISLMLILAGGSAGIFALAYVLAGEIYEFQDTVDGVHLPKVDAIVCLAGGRGRIAAAGDLWYRYWEQADENSEKPPVLYISGMGPQSTWNAFAHQLRLGVREVIRAENVVMETESTNTEANARYLAKYARESGWKKILLVTSSYHMKRARYIFERELRAESPQNPVQVETLSLVQDPFEAGEWKSSLFGIRVTIVEYFKWIYYRYFP